VTQTGFLRSLPILHGWTTCRWTMSFCQNNRSCPYNRTDALGPEIWRRMRRFELILVLIRLLPSWWVLRE
jgi:hypothetical protein